MMVLLLAVRFFRSLSLFSFFSLYALTCLYLSLSLSFSLGTPLLATTHPCVEPPPDLVNTQGERLPSSTGARESRGTSPSVSRDREAERERERERKRERAADMGGTAFTL